MQTTTETLIETAHIITTHGLHTGNQFAATDSDAIDICAAVYMAAEGTCPPEFSTDEDTSLAIISASAPAMAAIRALSDALESDVNDTEIAPGYTIPDHIEHVTQWVLRPGIGCTEPPTVDEVIGRILRAANTLAIQTSSARPGFTDEYGLCLTCRGHGSLMVDGEEIPYEELSPRRKQGHDLGHRFYRNTSKPCPDCDGQDRVTDAVVSAYEATL
ncbi:hypothetical protein [Streptomyces sp. SID161]|uniref:DUF6197 family protein n=1 Tax=Streptomyces sp. SID161 TaxID=2690251 RepID=UPI00136F541B|nr:hypothetical protein [Streptomyces sp. SID161]MYW49636.1 hypothetical protein [Streptomyces sp. SID161]